MTLDRVAFRLAQVVYLPVVRLNYYLTTGIRFIPHLEELQMQIPESAPTPHVRFAVALALIGALGPSAVDMYLASLPGIAEEYGASYARVQLTLTVFLLAMGAGQLLFGPVVDTLGRRRPLLVGWRCSSPVPSPPPRPAVWMRCCWRVSSRAWAAP